MADTPEARRVLAVFDFDGTLTYADSFLPFLREQAGFFRFWFGAVLLSPFVILQAAGVMSNSRAKEKFLKFFLGGRTPGELEGACRRFVDGRLKGLMNPRALERMEWHQKEGHELHLLSASPELYLRFWSERERFASLMGTRLRLENGWITGAIEGKNCHGRAKVERLEEAFGDLTQHEIYSYGDSRSDRHVLDRSGHPGFRSFGSGPGYKVRALLRFVRALV